LVVLSSVFIAVAHPRAAHAQDLSCTQGDREVLRLDFTGNETFSRSELARRIVTTPSSFGRRNFGVVGTRRCLDPAEFRQDVLRLQQFYHDRGFYDATVDTSVKVLLAKPPVVEVTFEIHEGLPTLLDSLRITGLQGVPDSARVLEDLDLAVGKPFGLVPFTAEVDSITSRLRNSGYPEASVLPAYSVHPADRRAEVALTVLPGPAARFGEVHVHSTSYSGDTLHPAVPDDVVRRLLGFSSGQPYSDRAIADAQRNLYTAGIYRHVEVTRDSVTPDSLVPVEVVAYEDQMHEIDSELGWATLDCFRAGLQYADRNFASSARSLALTGRLTKLGYGAPLSSGATRQLCPLLRKDSLGSSKLNYSLTASLQQPIIAGRANPAYSLYTERRSEYQAYLRTTFVGGEASLLRPLRRNASVRAAYNVEYGYTLAQPAVLCAVFSRCDQESMNQVQRKLPLAIASLAFQQARTDNPVDPHAGTVFRTEVRGSAPVIGSDPSLSFLKGTVDGSWYHQLTNAVVFALRLRGGAITGGSSTNGARLPPPSERLYAGGPTSVRGFQQNELGSSVYLVDSSDVKFPTLTAVGDSGLIEVKSTVARAQRAVPTGGNSLFVGNAEFRIRDPFFPNLLEYAVFTDVGDVWTRSSGQNFTSAAKLYWTPGVGIRYFSPVGPIQVNAGYNPYAGQSGPAFLSTRPGSFAPLYCVSPGNALYVHLKNVAGSSTPQLVQDTTSPTNPEGCPASFVSSHPNGFFQRLTFTLSIGSDF
jgi:outer membrane protein insertion porin family/translocation and assembly module TamA